VHHLQTHVAIRVLVGDDEQATADFTLALCSPHDLDARSQLVDQQGALLRGDRTLVETGFARDALELRATEHCLAHPEIGRPHVPYRSSPPPSDSGRDASPGRR